MVAKPNWRGENLTRKPPNNPRKDRPLKEHEKGGWQESGLRIGEAE